MVQKQIYWSLMLLLLQLLMIELLLMRLDVMVLMLGN